MIVENGITDDPTRVGFYSGIIESIFSLMGFLVGEDNISNLTSLRLHLHNKPVMPCSMVSDRVGRKPVVLVGTFGLAISTALFGVSKTYWSMIGTRCLGGTLGGTWA